SVEDVHFHFRSRSLFRSTRSGRPRPERNPFMPSINSSVTGWTNSRPPSSRKATRVPSPIWNLRRISTGITTCPLAFTVAYSIAIVIHCKTELYLCKWLILLERRWILPRLYSRRLMLDRGSFHASKQKERGRLARAPINFHVYALARTGSTP